VRQLSARRGPTPVARKFGVLGRRTITTRLTERKTVKGPSNASSLGAVVLTLASFSTGCRPPTPIDVERSVNAAPVNAPTVAEVPNGIFAARPQHQQLLDQVLRAEKLLEVYDDLWFSDQQWFSFKGSQEIGRIQIAPELKKINLSIDSSLVREDSQFTERQSIALEQASKSLTIVTRHMVHEDLVGGSYGSAHSWSSNLDLLYRAQADLMFARLHLEGVIKSIK
jgi:hypothetical protein